MKPENCIDCGTCRRACPAIQHLPEAERAEALSRPGPPDVTACANCHMCEAVCPRQVQVWQWRQLQIGRRALTPGQKHLQQLLEKHGMVMPLTEDIASIREQYHLPPTALFSKEELQLLFR